MYRIILVCGSGASSGFMAANLRKAASGRGLDCKIFARSDTELSEYLHEVDVVMLGSHYAYMLEDIRAQAAPYGVAVDVIDAKDYGLLDGEAVLLHALRLLEAKGEKG